VRELDELRAGRVGVLLVNMTHDHHKRANEQPSSTHKPSHTHSARPRTPLSMHMQNMHSLQPEHQTLDTVRHLTAGRLQRCHSDTTGIP